MKIKFWITILLFSLSTAFLLPSCSEPEVDDFDVNEQWKSEVAAIDQFLANNNITAVKDSSGIRMVITELGTGIPASSFANSEIEADYVGKLFSNSSVFDQGTITENVNSVIEGWRLAFTKLPAGTTATLYIPSYFAYRQQQKEKIPANSTLVFDVVFKRTIMSNTQKSQFTKDTLDINDFIEEHDIQNVVVDSSGIRYAVTELGTGAIPTWYNKVDLKYSFRSAVTGNFIETYDDTPSALMNYLNGIKIPLMKLPAGTKVTLFIPSIYAFGDNAITGKTGQVLAPPNTMAIIDIESFQVL